jgi:hypothetical protein
MKRSRKSNINAKAMATKDAIGDKVRAKRVADFLDGVDKIAKDLDTGGQTAEVRGLFRKVQKNGFLTSKEKDQFFATVSLEAGDMLSPQKDLLDILALADQRLNERMKDKHLTLLKDDGGFDLIGMDDIVDVRDNSRRFLTVSNKLPLTRIQSLVDVENARVKDTEKNRKRYEDLAKVISNPDLSEEQVAAYLSTLKPDYQGEGKVVVSNRHLLDLESGRRLQFRSEDGKTLADGTSTAIADALEEIRGWEQLVSCPKLEKNEHTRLHRLVDCVERGTSVQVTQDGTADPFRVWDSLQTFVVKHDWVAAFGESLGEVTSAELRMPYKCVAFEFVISGRPVILVSVEAEDKTLVRVFAEAKNGIWVDYGFDYGQKFPVYDFAWKQVQAICVMLDSDVAETSTVQPATALNIKRQKSGKFPLKAYHVVDLSVRHRHRKQSIAPPTGRHVRAHWRRGYWMHADERPKADASRSEVAARWQHDGKHWKTWIKWMIKGDPDLGFVEKEYKL